MKNENYDILGEKCIKDDDGNLAFDNKSKLAVWNCNYKKLLNVEFPWDSNTFSEEQPFQGSPIRITNEIVSEALSRIKKGEATGPSGLNVEMILAGGDDIILAITHLINCIIAENKIPDDWCLSYIINCYKGKGDVLLRGTYTYTGTYTCNHHKNSCGYRYHAIGFNAWEKNYQRNLHPPTSSRKVSRQT